MENADSDTLREIHRMVEIVRYDKEVSLEYMKVCEREMMIREEGENYGRKEGQLEEKIRVIRKLSDTIDSERLGEIVELSKEEIDDIITLFRNYPEESDEQIAVDILKTDISKDSKND